MFVRVMYTTVSVRDQDKALDFYTWKLGLEKRRDHPVREPGLEDGRFLTVGFQGQDLEVILAPRTPMAGRSVRRVCA
jgi:catechol 2,3-dioxygenase-like lactoylglutathione lyase family enzyme